MSLQPLVILEYDLRWPERFETAKLGLERALGRHALRIEHVGSTSVPGLAAKPVVDIAVGIHVFPLPRAALEAVIALGYEFVGEHGIPRRHYFRKGNPRTHHIHILEVTSEQFIGHILFRDYVRAHPEAARQYENLKRDLAARSCGDHNRYQEGKGPFIESAIVRADGGVD